MKIFNMNSKIQRHDKDINLEQKWVSQIYKNNGEFRRMNSSGSDQEGLMTDDQDLKQIIINRALQGCGNDDCQNVYCKSSKNFKFHNFGEAQIPNLVTNPQIMYLT
ncbi:hypothetical protein PPERSA_02927 [Pseudocohnilembus persalinus]|uniref:Ubiquitin-protein ligase E3A N-terminal zinc-binding domain-containing protein n=1 Tax=Pseudocohnilembus persalinus TaxID=266149 RepID=A0A0V0R6S7_PSEPJ|nr:hypothetical protein PPERSA_02927 [Pseudocohnilembus persalinus]|eukprot:KRX10188.1 hypothetical protein PPERSA_02927 [Pseudocohnilembus persalinus]